MLTEFYGDVKKVKKQRAKSSPPDTKHGSMTALLFLRHRFFDMLKVVTEFPSTEIQSQSHRRGASFAMACRCFPMTRIGRYLGGLCAQHSCTYPRISLRIFLPQIVLSYCVFWLVSLCSQGKDAKIWKGMASGLKLILFHFICKLCSAIKGLFASCKCLWRGINTGGWFKPGLNLGDLPASPW